MISVNHMFIKRVIVVTGLFLISGFAATDRALCFDFPDWEHGASGHRNALALALEEEMPLIV